MDNICSQAELRMFELFTNCSAVKQTHHLRRDSFNSSSQSFFVVKTTNYNLVRQIPFTRTENVAIGKLRTLHIQTASSLKYDTCFFSLLHFSYSLNQSIFKIISPYWLTDFGGCRKLQSVSLRSKLFIHFPLKKKRLFKLWHKGWSSQFHLRTVNSRFHKELMPMKASSFFFMKWWFVKMW